MPRASHDKQTKWHGPSCACRASRAFLEVEGDGDEAGLPQLVAVVDGNARAWPRSAAASEPLRRVFPRKRHLRLRSNSRGA